MESKLTIPISAILLLLLVVSVVVVECGRSPDISIVKGPTCDGDSKNNGYSRSAKTLVANLVKETKNVHRTTAYEDYRYSRKYPNSYPGSVKGAATCSGELGKSECLGCLMHAQGKLSDGCDDPVMGSIKLQDCSIWFDKIC